MQVSATVQSRSGPDLLANANVPSAVAQSLGRPLSGGGQRPVNLLNPGQLYGDRVTQIDFRVAKILRFGRTRTNVGVDFYNVTNPADLDLQQHLRRDLAATQTFMPARFVKVTGQLSF